MSKIITISLVSFVVSHGGRSDSSGKFYERIWKGGKYLVWDLLFEGHLTLITSSEQFFWNLIDSIYLVFFGTPNGKPSHVYVRPSIGSLINAYFGFDYVCSMQRSSIRMKFQANCFLISSSSSKDSDVWQ